MNIAKITEAREQIQEDLICLLDAFDADLQEKACQIVCDNFRKMIDEITEEESQSLDMNKSIVDPDSV